MEGFVPFLLHPLLVPHFFGWVRSKKHPNWSDQLECSFLEWPYWAIQMFGCLPSKAPGSIALYQSAHFISGYHVGIPCDRML